MMKNKWPTKKLCECLEKNSETRESVLKSEYLNNGTYPVIDQSQNFIAGYTDDETKIYKENLPVIIFGDHTRALKYIDFPFATGADGTKILKPSNYFDSRFFYLMVKSLDLENRGYGRHFKILKDSEIPLPPLEEQKRIVQVLEEKLGKVKEAIALREDAIADTEKVLSAKLSEIFTEGKEKDWEEKTMDELCEVARGGSPRPIKDYLTEDKDGINWVKIGDASASDRYIYKTRQKIKQDGVKKTRLVHSGDLLLTNSMSFGRPYIMKTEGAIHDGWLLLSPREKVVPEYLYYFLSSPDLYRQFKNLAGGAVVQNLNSQLVRGVKVSLPDFATQEKIVEELDELSSQVSELRALQEEQMADLKSLERAYLHEAFNGELV